ncbi:MAG: Gldg family protein [Bacillota bacterium]|nr:Gldg family protein [Bacillota bacterium]
MRTKKFKEAFDKEHIKSTFKGKTFKVGTYSIFSSILIIAIAAIVIMMVDALPAKYTKFDTTKNGIYSLSEQSENIASAASHPVNIYLIAQSGNEDKVIQALLEKYEDLSKNIKVYKKDPVIYPNFAKQYTKDEVYNNSIVVECGKKTRYISYNEIYKAGYNYQDNSQSTEFNGEGLITSAINYVTSTDLPRMYTLTGHGETELGTNISSCVQEENIETLPLNLLKESIPKDANCILINNPQSDISTSEVKALTDYIEGGGNLLLMTSYIDKDLANLNELTRTYGAYAENRLVLEGDSSMCLKGYNYYLTPNISDHTITKPLIESKYNVLLPIAHIIRKAESIPSGVTVTDILTTSNKAFAKLDGYNMKTTDKEANDVQGQFSLGVAITKKINDKEAKIVWFSSSEMLSEQTDSLVSGGNKDLFLNALNWMCNRDENIAIHTKSLAQEFLTVNSAAISIWSLVFIFIIPAVTAILGIYIFVRRKKR